MKIADAIRQDAIEITGHDISHLSDDDIKAVTLTIEHGISRTVGDDILAASANGGPEAVLAGKLARMLNAMYYDFN